MSNLGLYQVLTTTAKKVGGPLNLVFIIAGSGAVLGSAVVEAGKSIKNKIVALYEQKKQLAAAAVVHRVLVEGTSNEGLHFNVNDQFKVLEIDGDACLIDLIGDTNSPYFVSLKFLRKISDYESN